MRPRTAFGPVDLNSSSLGLDASMLSMGCEAIDTTARLDSRKSLSSSQIGRSSFVRPAPPSAKKSLLTGRPSLMPGGDRCVLFTSLLCAMQITFDSFEMSFTDPLTL